MYLYLSVVPGVRICPLHHLDRVLALRVLEVSLLSSGAAVAGLISEKTRKKPQPQLRHAKWNFACGVMRAN